MTGVKSKALVLLHEEHFKKGKFFLHVELIPARQADIVRKKREKDGFKHLSIILGTSPEFQLWHGEKVNISIKGALKPAISPVSGQMTIEFDGGNNCSRHFPLAVNESDESSLAEVTFTRTKKNQFLLQVTIDISEYRAKDKPTLQWNDLNATGTCNTLDHRENIPGGPDSLNDNIAQPVSSKDFSKDLNDSMKRLNISSTEGNSFSGSENTATGSYTDDTSKWEEPTDSNLNPPSPYSKIISDKGLAELANVISPGDLWQLLISLGLTDDRIRHHHQDKGNLTIALAGKAALSEWRNNNIKAGEKELVRNLIQELESLGRVDVAETIKTICKQNRYPSKTDFQH